IVLPLTLMFSFLPQWTWICNPTPHDPLIFNKFFGASNTVSILGVNITYHELLSLALAVVIALALRYLFFRTRSGVAMRAVVDDPALLELNGCRPERLATMAWALGSMLAALPGIHLTSITGSA